MHEEARKAWLGAGGDIEFDPSDFEVLDLVVGLSPELRICAWALKQANKKQLSFPIQNAEALFYLLEEGKFEGGGHTVTPSDIVRFIPPDFFPIKDEGEFISRIYIGLLRCKHEASLKSYLAVQGYIDK